MGKAVEPSQWLSLIASFALVLVLLLGTLWVLRRIGAAGLRSQSGRRLAVVESLWLGNRQRVVLLRVDDRELLLGVSGQGIQRLDGPGSMGDHVSVSGSGSGMGDTSPGSSLSNESSRAGHDPAAPVRADVRTRFLDAMRSMSGRPSGGEGR